MAESKGILNEIELKFPAVYLLNLCFAFIMHVKRHKTNGRDEHGQIKNTEKLSRRVTKSLCAKACN